MQRQQADNIIKAIKRVEMEFQNALDQSYTTMGDTTFKALRYAQPRVCVCSDIVVLT